MHFLACRRSAHVHVPVPSRIGRQNLVQAAHRSPCSSLHYGFNDCRNIPESSIGVEERLHGDLVGGIELAQRAAHQRGPPPAPDARQRKRCGSGARKSSRPALHQIQEFYTGSRCARATQARGRSACACPATPSCASTEPSTYSTSECTMLCGCTTTRHIALAAGRTARWPRSAPALVHQRGRIHRDLAAHDPARVRAGLLGRRRVAAPRPASRGTGRPRRSAAAAARPRAAPRRGARRQALEDRVVLAVDRHQRRRPSASPRRSAAGPPSPADSLFASSRRLPAPAAASVERRPAAPTDRGHDIVHLGRVARSPRVRRAPASTRVPGAWSPQQLAPAPRGRARIGQRRVGRAANASICRSTASRVAARGERDDAEALADGARAHRGCCRRRCRWSRGRRRPIIGADPQPA